MKTALPRRRLVAGLVVLAALFAAPARAATPTEVSPAPPRVPERVFNLRDFAAVADGHTDDQPAFRRALAAVNSAGGGTLLVPAGEYLTGPLDLCSNLNLRLEPGARLRFSIRREDYPIVNGQVHALVQARDCHDVVISGAGILDGQGQSWWDEFRRSLRAGSAAAGARPVPRERRPRLVMMENCERVRIEGVTLMNAPMFQCVPSNCRDVTIDGITVQAPNTAENHAYNTDGIDPIGSQRVLIRGCVIDTGDDCIALKATEGHPVADVLITDCVFRQGHGCSIGSGTSGGVRNVTVRRCTFEGTALGIQIKTYRDRGGVVENIYCTDLAMKRVPVPIGLSTYYPGRLAPKPDQPVAPAAVTKNTPFCRDILIRNLTAESATEAGRLLGLPESPLGPVTLEHVRITAATGIRIAYAQDITLRDVQVTVTTGAAIRPEHGVEGLRQLK